MASTSYNLLTTDGINSFIQDYTTKETTQKVTPLTTKLKGIQDLDTDYSSMIDKLGTLKNQIYPLQLTSSNSGFLVKTATSSNTEFADISATSAAVANSHALRVNQLAKTDLVISNNLATNSISSEITAPGTHDIVITAGDGKGGTYTSHVAVTFDSSDFTNGTITNSQVMQKVQDAIGGGQAVMLSNSVSGTTSSAGSFNINLGGTVTNITYSAGNYSDVIDNVISQINKLKGVIAEKVVNGSSYQLKVTVTDPSKYITINGDTSGLLSEMNAGITEEMGSAGLATASSFSPEANISQLSLNSKQSGYDYRISSIADSNGGKVLDSIGLNLGSNRQQYVQNEGGEDTAGYVYATSALNAKIDFNGINIQRDSNTISDLIPGSTLTLKSTMQDTDSTVNLTIGADTAKIKQSITDFITNFNAIYTYIKTNSEDNKGQRGLLIDDTSAQSLQNLFISVATTSVAGLDTSSVNNLSRLGLSFDIEDGLTIEDGSQLTSAIYDHPDQLAALFNSDNGIAKKLYNSITPYINANGYLYQSRNNFGTQESDLNDQIKSAQDSINTDSSNLRLRYLKQMAQTNSMLQSQQTFLQSGFFNATG